jgi:hypothetical protein
MPAPVDPATIARLEAIEAHAYRNLAMTAAPTCGTGIATVDGVTITWFPGDDDPDFTSITGLERALDPVVTLARIESLAREHGAVVLGMDGVASLLAQLPHERLEALGFRRDYQECTWVRYVPASVDPRPLSPGLRITSAGIADRSVFARTFNVGFEVAPELSRGLAFAQMIGEPGWRHYLAWVDEQPAGVAVLYMHDRIGSFFMASTVPGLRGRGAQGALIDRRIAECVAAGCELMTAQSVVGNASPRNFARRGFEEVGTYWVYRKDL